MTIGRAPRAAASRTRCSSRYTCPRCSPSNTPTTTNSGLVRRGRGRAQAPRGLHASRPDRRGALGEHLVRVEHAARRPGTRRRSCLSGPTASTSGASGTSSGVLGPVGRPSNRRRSSSAVIVACGRSSSPASIGRSSDANPSAPPAAPSRSASNPTASSRRNPPDAVRTSAPRYAPLPSDVPRSRASARMYVPAEQRDLGHGDGPGGVAVVPLEERELVDHDVARRQLHRLARRGPSGTRGDPRSGRRCTAAGPGGSGR